MNFQNLFAEFVIEEIEVASRVHHEGLMLEFKSQVTDRIAEAACALANTYGGVILVGVEEDGKGKMVIPIKGLDSSTSAFQSITDTLLARVYPPVLFESKIVHDRSQSRSIIVIEISPSDRLPHAVDLRHIYRRSVDRNRRVKDDFAELSWIEKIYREGPSKEPFFEKSLENMDYFHRQLYNIYGDKIVKPGSYALHSYAIGPQFRPLNMPSMREWKKLLDLCSGTFVNSVNPIFSGRPIVKSTTGVLYWWNEDWRPSIGYLSTEGLFGFRYQSLQMEEEVPSFSLAAASDMYRHFSTTAKFLYDRAKVDVPLIMELSFSNIGGLPFSYGVGFSARVRQDCRVAKDSVIFRRVVSLDDLTIPPNPTLESPMQLEFDDEIRWAFNIEPPDRANQSE